MSWLARAGGGGTLLGLALLAASLAALISVVVELQRSAAAASSWLTVATTLRQGDSGHEGTNETVLVHEGVKPSIGMLASSASSSLEVAATLLLSLALFVASLPLWMPPLLIAVRFYIFRAINGEEGVELPNANLGVENDTFKKLYNDKACDGRSKQANYGLSDFFWYLLAPAHAIHQEHVESSDIRYRLVASATRKLCAVPTEQLQAIAVKHARELFDVKMKKGSWEVDERAVLGSNEDGYVITNLRDLFFPTFERMVYELVFGVNLSDARNKLITRSAENVINGVKGLERRDMRARRELCDLLLNILENTDGATAPGAAGNDHKASGERSNREITEHHAELLKEALSTDIGREEWALFLQGVFFTTGVVQLSEGMSHIALALAQHPQVYDKLSEELRASPDPATTPEYLRWVIGEALRVWPLFGIAHRITSADIKVPSDASSATETVLPKGSVLCFNYPKYHMTGYEDPEAFRPERWATLRPHQANYIPFGAPRNRPCPGERLSLIWMRVFTRVLVEKVHIHSVIEHTRSLPSGGLALLVPKDETLPKPSALKMSMLLGYMRAYEAFASVYRSTMQTFNGAYMLRESQKLQLAQKYFRHYHPFDPSVAHKPCLSNQLYR